MYRIAMEKLFKWKQGKHRKPLIIEGARQVEKTWLMKEFDRQAYRDTVYINFDSNSRMAELFASDLDVYYYTNDRGSCEVGFVVDTGQWIVPVEVKAEVNLRAKSLKSCREKFSPPVSIRTSMADYKKEEWLLNLPPYAIDRLKAVTDI